MVTLENDSVAGYMRLGVAHSQEIHILAVYDIQMTGRDKRETKPPATTAASIVEAASFA